MSEDCVVDRVETKNVASFVSAGGRGFIRTRVVSRWLAHWTTVEGTAWPAAGEPVGSLCWPESALCASALDGWAEEGAARAAVPVLSPATNAASVTAAPRITMAAFTRRPPESMSGQRGQGGNRMAMTWCLFSLMHRQQEESGIPTVIHRSPRWQWGPAPRPGSPDHRADRELASRVTSMSSCPRTSPLNGALPPSPEEGLLPGISRRPLRTLAVTIP